MILCLESLNIILSYGLARVFGLSREGAQAALHQPRGADEVRGGGGAALIRAAGRHAVWSRGQTFMEEHTDAPSGRE